MNGRKSLQRMLGYLKKRLRELKLAEVEDPRRRQGRRWKLSELLTAALVGLMSGRNSLVGMESLTGWMGSKARKQLGLPRRLPDTTLRDLLCRLPVEGLRGLLHRAVRKARRRKALKHEVLPFHQVAMDGKADALPCWEGPYAQKHEPEDGVPYGVLRTVTSVLVTAAGRPCIDVSPIPAETNEMGHFETAFGELVGTHGSLFTLVSYDAGANGEQNARLVRQHGKHYLFRLNDERWHMQQLARELLADKAPASERVDVVSNCEEVHRSIRLFRVNDGPMPPLPRKSTIWGHARLLLRVDAKIVRDGVIHSEQTRYFISSLPRDAMSPKQWLDATVLHWGVEICHQTLDVAFLEDDRPWVRADANGMLAVLVLRRIAYTLLTLWRSVTLRSQENRHRPWREILEWAYVAVIQQSENSAVSG